MTSNKYLMKRVCAWCKTTLTEGDPDNPRAMVTHTICPSCLKKLRAEIKDRRAISAC
jgi:hypothetical protein